MRVLLMSLLLISAVLLIYMATIGGADGVLSELKRSNKSVQQRIESLNP